MPSPTVNEIIMAQLTELYEQQLTHGQQGASYYAPETLTEADKQRFGMAVTHVDGSYFHIGDSEHPFPLHSISKVFTYAQALEDRGRAAVLSRVGVEPSGDPFNSITFDEANHRPFNPMINAGALVAANLVRGAGPEEKVGRILERLRTYAGNPDLRVDADVLAKELVSNDRNLALSYLMRSQGMLDGDLEDNIAVYLSICSVLVTARDLAMMGATLANGGVNPLTGERALHRGYVRDLVTVMATCGMYDEAGQWSYDVGLPAKSSVSGAILVVIPHRVGGGFFSPGLNRHGNSIRGINLCRELSEHFGLHVFADPDEATLGRRGDALVSG
jgi:glutaminase